MYRPGYAFSIEQYLNHDVNVNSMEMHVLQQSKLFAIARKTGGQVIEVMENDATGQRHKKEVSNRFLIRKA